MRDRVVQAGGDPSLVPDEDFRFLRLREVEARVGLRRSSLYRRIAAKEFPAPVLLGEASERVG
jgi:predicted DNA-binding transcriptional regulator AlpA